MTAVEWARRRILAFRGAVMRGGSVGSAFPLHTQEEPYEQEGALRDPAELAAHGLLLTPHYAFTARYEVSVDANYDAWAAAAAGTVAEGDVAALPPAPRAQPGGGSFAPGTSGDDAALLHLWGRTTGVTRWAVLPPAGLEPDESRAFAQLPRVREHLPIDPDAHARAFAPCLLDHMFTGTYSHDLERLHRAIVQENRYPPLNDVLASGNSKATGLAVFRPADRQPLPQVLTAFDVVVGDTGYLFTPQGGSRVPRVTEKTRSGAHDSFRPIQCLYRCVCVVCDACVCESGRR
jgi:hypothetical protein